MVGKVEFQVSARMDPSSGLAGTMQWTVTIPPNWYQEIASTCVKSATIISATKRDDAFLGRMTGHFTFVWRDSLTVTTYEADLLDVARVVP